MKFGVIVFPGSNCDDDMIHVLGEVMGHPVEKIWHKESELPDFGSEDVIIVPGGFSYGDYLRAGALAKLSPVMQAVGAFARQGGHVIGICNGFQVLCEAGLLPGALLRNRDQQFISRVCHLATVTHDSALTSKIPHGKALAMPMAHAEGRYYCDAETLAALKENDQIIFRYASPEGEVTDEYNWNGSVESIAGVCNRDRNVYGMMPHPERASEDILGGDDGQHLWRSLASWIPSRVVSPVEG